MILMKIIAFTGAGISKQSNIPTFMERPDVREKLFRSYAQRHHEEYKLKQKHPATSSPSSACRSSVSDRNVGEENR